MRPPRLQSGQERRNQEAAKHISQGEEQRQETQEEIGTLQEDVEAAAEPQQLKGCDAGGVAKMATQRRDAKWIQKP